MIPVRCRLTRLALLTLATAVSVLPAAADAQKKKKRPRVKPACGIKALPFAEGVHWTYGYYVPEGVQLPPGVRIEDPPSLTIKVLDVDKNGGKTVISLEESYRKVSVKTQLECDKDGLIVPPTSFFFAGQPGGGLLMTLGKIERKAETNVFAGGGLKGEAFEELKTTVTREATPGTGATLAAAKLELERKMTVGGTESVESDLGTHRATRLNIQMTGRAILDSTPDKPFNMPTLDVAMFIEPNVGVVEVRNSQGQGWKLQEHDVE